MLHYCSTLYAADPIDIPTALSFLEKILLTKVTPSQLEGLTMPISLPEISTAIQNLAPSKAPGPDGYTGEFYKSLKTLLEPTLHKVYQHIWSGGSYVPTGNHHQIPI